MVLNTFVVHGQIRVLILNVFGLVIQYMMKQILLLGHLLIHFYFSL